LTYFWNRSLSTLKPYDWMDMSCCIQRQLCQERNNWIHVKNSSVAIVNVFGLQVPLGNTGILVSIFKSLVSISSKFLDFHRETYRACALDQYGTKRDCP